MVWRTGFWFMNDNDWFVPIRLVVLELCAITALMGCVQNVRPNFACPFWDAWYTILSNENEKSEEEICNNGHKGEKGWSEGSTKKESEKNGSWTAEFNTIAFKEKMSLQRPKTTADEVMNATSRAIKVEDTRAKRTIPLSLQSVSRRIQFL